MIDLNAARLYVHRRGGDRPAAPVAQTLEASLISGSRVRTWDLWAG